MKNRHILGLVWTSSKPNVFAQLLQVWESSSFDRVMSIISETRKNHSIHVILGFYYLAAQENTNNFQFATH